jgi:hypothetical protein
MKIATRSTGGADVASTRVKTTPDGREVAAALYGGPADSDTDDEDDGTQ